MGKSRSAVANALRLLGLAPGARELVEQGKLSAGHARALLPLPADLQESTALMVVLQGLSVRETERLAKKMGRQPPEESDPGGGKRPPADVDYTAEAQKDLASRLGRGVKIVTGKKKGRVELEYYGVDDLNDLLEALALIQVRKRGPEA